MFPPVPPDPHQGLASVSQSIVVFADGETEAQRLVRDLPRGKSQPPYHLVQSIPCWLPTFPFLLLEHPQSLHFDTLPPHPPPGGLRLAGTGPYCSHATPYSMLSPPWAVRLL